MDSLDHNVPNVIRHHYFKKFPSGMGDFFRSSMIIYKHIKNENLRWKSLGYKGSLEYEMYFKGGNLENCFDESIEDPLKNYVYLKSNSYKDFDYNTITKEDKEEWIRLLSLTLKKKILDLVLKEFNDNPFSVGVHVRIGDSFTQVRNPNVRIEEHNLSEIVESLKKLRKFIGENIPIRLFTDSSKLKKLLKKQFDSEYFYFSNVNPTHTAYMDRYDHRDSLVEFLLMFRCDHIYSYISRADYPKMTLSSFSFFPSYICDIPLKIVCIDKDSSRTYENVYNCDSNNLFYEFIEIKHMGSKLGCLGEYPLS